MFRAVGLRKGSPGEWRRSPFSFTTGDAQIKTTPITVYHLSPGEKSKSLAPPHAPWPGRGAPSMPRSLLRPQKGTIPIRGNVATSNKTHLSSVLEPRSGTYPKESPATTQKNGCARCSLTEARFLTESRWKPPKWPRTGAWLAQRRCARSGALRGDARSGKAP